MIFSKNHFYFLLFAICLAASCKSSYKNHIAEYQNNYTNAQPDYANLFYWAAHPFKKDLSDSLPTALQGDFVDSTADVFFIYPTTFLDTTSIQNQPPGIAWNAKINDAEINAKTDYTTILNQASAFNHFRVFSPRYRQAHYRSFFIPPSQSQPIFDTAYADIKAAFEYYLKRYNQGRPIVLAAHSQGTVHAARLIKDFFEGQPLIKKLVCAYLVGMPVQEDYFAQLKPCVDSTQTGCFVSWRSWKNGSEKPDIPTENFKAVEVNPLSWKMDEELIKRSQNPGTILYNFSKIIPENVSAQIHGNILWVSKPKVFGNVFFNKKNYHIADINLFWQSIRNNVQCRVAHFVK